MRNEVIIVLAITGVAALAPAPALADPDIQPFPADLGLSLLVDPEGAAQVAEDLAETEADLWSDDALSSLDELYAELELDDLLLAAVSVPCEPGVVRAASREALGALLAGTPADLRGTQYRAPWFQAFPWTWSFPEAADMSGVVWRWSELGTVGKVRSTSPWPLWQNPGAPPADDAGRAAVARLFLEQNRRLILFRPAVDTLEVADVITGADGGFTVIFGQTYQRLRVLQARVLVRCDDLGDVFSMQSYFVPFLAVDTTPSVPASELWDIVTASGNPALASGAFDFSRGPELAVLHTNRDYCSGTLVWDFDVLAATGETFSYLVDAHRGTVHGWAPLDLADMDQQRVFNFKGNHPRQNDDNDCFDGTQDCNWFSTLDEAMTAADVQADWPVPAVVVAADIELGRLRCSQKCSQEGGSDCAVPPDFLWAYTDPAATGLYKTAYDSLDPTPGDGIGECPGHVENHASNPWSQINWNNPPTDLRYHPCRWIADDLGEIEDWVADMSTMLGTDSVTTTNDLFADVPDLDVLASEPVDPVDFVYVAPPLGWDPWRDDDFNDNLILDLGIGQRQRHFPHFPVSDSFFSVGGGWGSQHIILSAQRYNYLDMSGGNGDSRGADDVLYHEFGHYLYHGVPGGHYVYPAIDPFSTFDPEAVGACVMWRGIYTESGPDLVGAVLEYQRQKTAGNPDDRIDWVHSEGTGGTRDLQRPDAENLDTRHPESFNDFHVSKWDASGEHESEVHVTSGMVSRFYFLMGNHICDVENDCGCDPVEGCSDALSNAGHCSCWAPAGSDMCADPGGDYDRNQEKWHTIEPPSSCKHQQAAAMLGDPATEGFQQWHNGVKVSSLDRTHLAPPDDEDGLDVLGRIHALMLFHADVDTFAFTPTMPYDFMDAFFSALLLETGYTWPDSLGEVAQFYRARDSVGFWTPLGNYFEDLNPDVAAQGITAAMVNWGPGPDPSDPMWNTEWLLGFNPATNRIGLALRGCWNQDHDMDGDNDYCFASANWFFFVIDEPAALPSGPFVPRSVAAVDVNDDGDSTIDAHYGLWLVYRATFGFAAIDGICRRLVPIYPEYGFPTPRACDPAHETLMRPAAGHYPASATETREVIVYADANDDGQLKSFEWGVGASDHEIPTTGECAPVSDWRPEVVNHGGYVWAFWTAEDVSATGVEGICYSRFRHNPPPAEWEVPKLIPFEGQFTSCGDNDRRLAGPPSATERNGIINLAVRDVDLNGGAHWVWMIQLADVDPPGPVPADGEFWECDNTIECPGSCSADCGGRMLWEERSPWVPHAQFQAGMEEIGPMATTEHLQEMTTTSTGHRQDYAFFYNPTPIWTASAVLSTDMGVWARESW